MRSHAKPGRPRKMKAARSITVSLPAAMVRQVEAQARRQGVTRSEALRRLVGASVDMHAALLAARGTVLMVHQEFNSDRFTDRYGDGPKATERLAIIDAAIAKAEGK